MNSKIVQIFRWILLFPLTILSSLPLIYLLRFTNLPILFFPIENISYSTLALINLVVPMIQVYVADWIAPKGKRIVSLIVFSIICFLFLVGLITIFIETIKIENFFAGVGYFFNESWLEFLRPLGAWCVVKELGYWEKGTVRKSLGIKI